MILERLDTFIAFAVVMLLLSVMVMAFVQLIVSILGLRGRNLRWGVRLLLEEAAPEYFEAGGGLDADKIAHEMLTHPALGPARNWVAMLLSWILKKAPALEALGEASADDGRLRRAVRSLFETIGVFRNGRRPATALKPEDVIKVLERVQRKAAADAARAGGAAAKKAPTAAKAAPGAEAAAPGAETTAVAQKAAGSAAAWAGAEAAKAEKLAALLGAKAEEAQQFVAEGKKLAEGLRQQFPEQAKILERQIESIGKSGAHLAARVDEWFDTVMVATSERFKLRARWLTAAGALILAFGFQVDSMSIFRQLSGNPELRDALVAQATASQTLFEDLQKAAAEDAPRPAAVAAAPDTVHPETEDPDTEAPDAAARPALDPDSPEAARQRVETAKAGLAKANELVEATGLQLLHPMYQTWGELQADLATLLPFGDPPDTLLRKLGDGLSGKLMTVLLLSLGAPFWYGALSKLIGLRSAVAKKKENAQGGDGGGAGAGGQG